jgi:ribosomal protein L29
MSMSNINLKEKSSEDVFQALAEARQLSFKLQVQKATQQLVDFNKIRFLRRDIARIKTELRVRGECV